MNLPLQIRYDLDATGRNPNNLVVQEPHPVSTPYHRAIATNYGPFYTESLKVYDATTGNILTKNVDYVAAYLYVSATRRFGKEICAIIVVNNPTITGILVTYQVVGGEYTRAVPVIQTLLESINNDNRPVQWGEIIGLPAGFPPEPHLHDIGDTYGWENVVIALENINQSILRGDIASHEEIWEAIYAIPDQLARATIAEAIAGIDTYKLITPATLRAAMEAYFTGFQVVLPDLDEPWGYVRDTKTGWTKCFGTTENIAVGGAYRVNYKRRFNKKPILSIASLSGTTDTNVTTNTDFAQAFAVAAKHTLARDGFFAICNRLTGSGSDFAALHYMATGYSDDDQPEAVTPGFAANLPPSDAVLQQPVWTGITAATTTTSLVGNKIIGLLFRNGVVGGATLVQNDYATSAGNVSYTPYPGLFVDSEYEVMAHLVTTSNPAPNFTLIGRPLDVWIDLQTLKGSGDNSPTSGFVWQATGEYGGNITFSVQIRRKADHTKIAQRVFTFNQTSTAVAPELMNSPGSITFTVRTGDPDQYAEYWFANDGTERILWNYGNLADLNQPGGLWDNYGSTSAPGQIYANRNNYEVFFPAEYGQLNSEGYYDVGNANGGQWISLSTLINMNNGYRFRVRVTPNKTYPFSSNNNGYLSIRHKTDRVKADSTRLLINKVGDANRPNFSGDFNASYSNGAGTSGNYTFVMQLETPVSGQGILKVFHNGVERDSGAFTYSTGVTNWNSSNYRMGVRVDSQTSGLSYSGPLINPGVFQMTALSSTQWSWQGSFNTAAQVANLGISLQLQHIASGDSTIQAMAFSWSKQDTTQYPPVFSGGSPDHSRAGATASGSWSGSYTLSSDGTWTSTHTVNGSTQTKSGRWYPAGDPNYSGSNYQFRTTGANTNQLDPTNAGHPPPAIGYTANVTQHVANGPWNTGGITVSASGTVGNWGGYTAWFIEIQRINGGGYGQTSVSWINAGPDFPG